MLPTILIAIGAIVVILLIVVGMQPTDFQIQRSARIAAPAAIVFDQVNDLRKWEAWSPWDKIDPQLKRTYEGSPSGKGAIYRWVGNNKVGQGGMTIEESRPAELVKIKLEFVKPFTCTNAVNFTFKPQGDETEVTWTMTGKNNFMAKAMHLVMNMDKMVGGQFAQGLAQMKSVAEAAAKA